MFRLIPWKKRSEKPSGEVVAYRGDPRAQLRDEFDSEFDRFLTRWADPFRGQLGLGRFWALDVEEGHQENENAKGKRVPVKA
jgi:hypothetical protein